MDRVVSRRMVLTGLAAAGLAAPALLPARAASPHAFAAYPPDMIATRFEGLGTRFLWLKLSARWEEEHIAFRDPSGALIETALTRLSWIFRDWKDEDRAIWMDYRLFDLLAAVQTEATNLHDRPIRIALTSGFRTARRNATIEGAARNSQHLKGRAADIRLTGVAGAEVVRIAEHLGAHGIGSYPGFTHLDVGPPGRRW